MTARPWAHEGIPMPAATDVQPFPAGFRTEDIQTNGTTLYVRVGGQGPAVILLHGYGETGDMWASLAADLARDHTISPPTCAAWASPFVPPVATTRRHRARMSPAFSTRWGSNGRTSSPTTSAIWSDT